MGKAFKFGKFGSSIKDRISGDKRIKFIIFLGAVGVFLLIISGLFSSGASNKGAETVTLSVDVSEYTREIEKSLREIISDIDGAGKCSVMVTLDCGVETVYAEDVDLNSDVSDGRESSKESRELVTLNGSSSTKEAVVIKEIQPRVRGVIVVCEGGGNPGVKMNIINAVTSAFDISSTKVSVQKMSL